MHVRTQQHSTHILIHILTHTRTLIDRLQYYSIIIVESTTTATSATTTKGLLFYYSKPSDPNKSQAEAGEADEKRQPTYFLSDYFFIRSSFRVSNAYY